MSPDDSEKTEQMTVRIRAGLAAKMKARKPKGMSIGHIWSKAADVFLDLPDETRLQILTGKIEQPFVEIVRMIVDERLEAGRTPAETRRRRGSILRDDAQLLP